MTELDGMAAYPKPPVVQDHSERGTFTGTRIDSVTYVCERPGTVTVPALEFPWWNVRTQTMEMVTLPAVTLDVGHAPPSQSKRQPAGRRDRRGRAPRRARPLVVVGRAAPGATAEARAVRGQ